MIAGGLTALAGVLKFASWYWTGGGAETIQNTIAFWFY